MNPPRHRGVRSGNTVFQSFFMLTTVHRRSFAAAMSALPHSRDFAHRNPTCDMPVSGLHPWRALGR